MRNTSLVLLITTFVAMFGRYTPHDQYNDPKLPNTGGLMWVSNHKLVTNSGRASVMVGVCTLMNLSAGKENHSKLVRRTDRTETDLGSVCSKRIWLGLRFWFQINK